jgi:hypothetical protein
MLKRRWRTLNRGSNMAARVTIQNLLVGLRKSAPARAKEGGSLWYQTVMRFRLAVAIGAILLLAFATALSVSRSEPLALVAAVGVWLWVAREGYLMLFALAAFVVLAPNPAFC